MNKVGYYLNIIVFYIVFSGCSGKKRMTLKRDDITKQVVDKVGSSVWVANYDLGAYSISVFEEFIGEDKLGKGLFSGVICPPIGGCVKLDDGKLSISPSYSKLPIYKVVKKKKNSLRGKLFNYTDFNGAFSIEFDKKKGVELIFTDSSGRGVFYKITSDIEIKNTDIEKVNFEECY